MNELFNQIKSGYLDNLRACWCEVSQDRIWLHVGELMLDVNDARRLRDILNRVIPPDDSK